MHSSDKRRDEEGRSRTKESMRDGQREEEGGMRGCASHTPLRRRAFSRLFFAVQIGVCLCVLVPVTGMSGPPGAAPRPALKLSEKAERFKREANYLFSNNKFKDSVILYTAAINEDPENPSYFCNRAFAHIKMENYGQALEDAEASIALDNTFVKAYYRRGISHLALGKTKLALQDLRAVARLRPGDPAAQAKMKQCEKIVRLEAFEAAIRADKTASPFDSINLEEMPIEDTYQGPRWDIEQPISEEFVHEMMDVFRGYEDKEGRHCYGKLHKKYAYKILLECREIFQALNNVVELTIPKGTELTVCGDTHGQYFDLLNIFKLNGPPSPSNPYIFNGDFVDRGSWSFEVVMTLLAFKCLYPNSIHLTRGNHETVAMNKIYGFEGEVTTKQSKHMYECFVELFWYLPLAMTLNKEVFVCHGGLFRDDRVTLADINKVNRAVEPPDEGIVCDLLWSDPQNAPGRAASKRGTGCTFGPDVTERWLEENKLKLLVRSHEMKEDGYEVQHNGKCVTIFSAPNYCDQMGNLGALIRFASDCQPTFTRFAAAPHPEGIRPMHYAPMSMPGLM